VIVLETETKIRRLYHVGKQSIKEIARTLGISRNTIRRVIRQQSVDKGYQRADQPSRKLGDHKAQLEKWLLEESKLPKSQRCNARKFYDRLKAEGYAGAYDSIQRFVKQWHLESGRVGQAYVPLTFSPGEAYQFDWSYETVELGNLPQTVKVAHFRLCHSRLSFVVAYLRETQEMLFDAHDKAFAFFGGLPLRGIYDNLKTAIDTVFVGKDRQFNRGFLKMQDHYLIEPTACTPGAGWEKGQVENQVGNIREWFFVPRLKFASLAALNEYLHQACLQLAKDRRHPEQKALSIWEVYETQEKPALRPLVPPYEGYSERTCKVSSTCLVTFDRNHYSVDCRYAHYPVSLRAYAGRIEVVAKGKVIAHHVRHFGRGKTIYDPWHYVPLLERKPGALRNGAPFAQWDLPDALKKVKEHLLKKKGGDRQYVQILSAIQVHGMETVKIGCELALANKAVSSDYILNAINRLRPTQAPIVVQTPDNLKLTHEPQANCNRYESLTKGETR
jgi:transposase